MSKIKCSQEKCKYNNYEHCMKEGIKVDKEANCQSYEEGASNDNTKFEFAMLESLDNNVMCDASECLYNNKRNCIINSLNIGRNKAGAPCIDFEKRN